MITLVNVLLSLLILLVAVQAMAYPLKKMAIFEKFIATVFKIVGIVSLAFCVLGLLLHQADFTYSYLNIINLSFRARSFWMFGVMSILMITVAHFSFQYIHKEIGFKKFFLNFSLFWLGLFIFQFSGDNLVIFAGWELIGISSIFLIAFYDYRKSPVLNSLYVLTCYKVADILLITSLLFLKHSHLEVSSHPLDQYLYLLIIIAGIIKSASFPFTSWLPRAMEGPTPSSAIYYVALSTSTGILLIHKFIPEMLSFELCKQVLLGCGVLTIAYSSIQSRVQSDIKSSLAYSSSVQVGFVLVELAMGWVDFALIHLFANAILKIYQFIRTPSLLHIYHSIEGEHGKVFGTTGAHFEFLLPARLRKALYYLSLNHFYLDYVYFLILQLVKSIGKVSRLFLFPIAGNKGKVDTRSLLWGGYHVLAVILVSIGAINIHSNYFLLIVMAILFISSAMIFEKNVNTFIALFALYKILESLIIHSVHSHDQYKILSILVSGVFAISLVLLTKKKLSSQQNYFVSSVLVFMMLFFTNFPFLLQSLVNEHIIEALIGRGNFVALFLYCIANTFLNIGLYNFVFRKVYLEEAAHG